jgi:hypothetical protein
MRLPAVLALVMAVMSAKAASPEEVALRADIRFLSSDLLEGRQPGTRGYDMAAAYVVSRMEMLGLNPGVGGRWLQQLTLREQVPEVEKVAALFSDASLAGAVKIPDNALVDSDFTRLPWELTGKITYVGMGVCDPETRRDDGGRANLRGRFAAIFAGVATGLPASRAAVRSELAARWECLKRHGAVGLVVLRTPASTRLNWPSAIASWRSGGLGLVDGAAAHSRFQVARLLTLDVPAAKAFLAAAGRDLAEEEPLAQSGRFEPVEIPGTLTLRYQARTRDLTSANVVGVVPGTDGKLAVEAVVVSAHLDHLGVEIAGAIRTGAIDNASGIAQLLLAGQLLRAGPGRRTVIFLATTGEERGLLGAEHFVAHPTWPKKQLLANINVDQTGMLWPVVDVVADGAERSTLMSAASRAAARLGLRLSPDPVPEQSFFLRSDQAPFARAAIPAVIFRPGFADRDGGTATNRALFVRWRGHAYHAPADRFDQSDPPIDFASGVTMGRLVAAMATELANAEDRPRWNPSDVFAPAAR